MSIRNHQRGDTILEVLICIAVLGFLLAAAFSLANRNQTNARQAQERVEALQIANSQLELFKTYVDLHKLPPNNYFCMEPNDTIAPIVPGPGIIPASTIPVSPNAAATYPAQCVQGRYSFALWSPSVSGAIQARPDVYAVTVRWQSAGSSVTNEEVKIFYTIYDTQNITFQPPPPPGGPVSSIGIRPGFPNSVAPGGSTQILWNTDATATSCVGTNFPSPPLIPPRTSTFSTGPLAASRTYTLTCSNSVGTPGNTAAVTVPVVTPLSSPVTITPNAGNFPAWHMFNTGGVRPEQIFVVRNLATSPAPINLSNVSLSNPNSSFTITENLCNNATLPPGGSCSVTVQFYPPSGLANNRLGNAGLKTGTLTINNNSGVSPTNAALGGWAVSDRMGPDDRMYATGDDNDNAARGLRSYNAACYNNAFSCGNLLVLWSNGNLVEYTNAITGSVAWMTGATPGTQMYMQGSDGNLVLYTAGFVPVYNTGMAYGGVWLMLFPDSQLWRMNPAWNSGSYSGYSRIWP